MGRGCWWAVVLCCGLGAGSSTVVAQGAASPQKTAPAKPGISDPAPVAQPKGGVTPPQLQSGQTTVTVDQRLTQAQEASLLGDLNGILQFASKDTGLPIVHPVKGVFLSREALNKELRVKFDEDKGNKRMERSELVLKKFGLLDRDFHLRPFLLSLLTEQIAGFYDNKAKTMNLLDWVPVDQQQPVMAHELTHALQDQKVGLEKWENQEQEGVAKNVTEDNLHIATDETDTAREAVLEGQAMVSFADYALRPLGKTLKEVPQMVDRLENGAGDMSDSPVLARAPLILQQALLFPYTSGLSFEAQVLAKAGTQRAFAGMLAAPPNTSAEILHPREYLDHVPMPLMVLPDIHPMLTAAGYEPYDVGVMGELDVRMTAELFGGKPLAEALAPAWDGGIYYAAQRRSATAAEKDTTASLAFLYSSRWKNADSARSFFAVFQEELPRQYDGLTRRKADETSDLPNGDERVYSTREGDVLLVRDGNTVWVSEGFELPLSRKLKAMVDGAQGKGPVQQAAVSVPRGGLVGGLAGWMESFGVVREAVEHPTLRR